jgi:hypothetical protein
VVFNAAKVMMQNAEPRIESDFISVVSIASYGDRAGAVGSYPDRVRTQIEFSWLRPKWLGRISQRVAPSATH